ncbi:helix-turn-helix domain-containing protein [Amycolatopsis granulosa]|uniref:helix-turn-helix domain-containing protein n=1 Tax=Amycolatopsis granulosa TaxID=185684 RepID=UPI00142456B2|nr:helix-turn-helix domain-containing protein [Amycolatopsis granulosa]NIH88333.1 DNA-binding transcriptional ArsR family regulator [Amycolatopsis granulosa]
MDITQLILHPIRLRIVNAVFDGRPFTTSQLRERLPDVPKATMYRHVGLLVESGLIEVDGEERKAGAVERTYRLHRSRTVIDGAAAAAMSNEDHRRGFAAGIASLLGEFEVYLGGRGADPTADMVTYRQVPLWLDDAEKEALYDDLIAAIRKRLDHKPSADRRRHLLATIMFPAQVEP